jgi:hypothetical protein
VHQALLVEVRGNSRGLLLQEEEAVERRRARVAAEPVPCSLPASPPFRLEEPAVRRGRSRAPATNRGVVEADLWDSRRRGRESCHGISCRREGRRLRNPRTSAARRRFSVNQCVAAFAPRGTWSAGSDLGCERSAHVSRLIGKGRSAAHQSHGHTTSPATLARENELGMGGSSAWSAGRHSIWPMRPRRGTIWSASRHSRLSGRVSAPRTSPSGPRPASAPGGGR